LSLRWYYALADADQMQRAAWNSLVIAFWTTTICVVLGTAAALAVARSRARWLRVCDLLFMSPLFLPALAFGFAALVYVNKLGFSPSIGFLVLGHVVVCVPFVLRTTVASLSQLDPALLDASYSLGGGWWMTFRRVTLPLVAPGLTAGGFLAFMASFDNVPVSLFLADERTEVLPIHLWQQIDTNLDVRTAAASGLIVIFTLALMLIAERLAGLTRQIR
jgi:putative spermidine/putrescine transport system permease protein